MPDRGSALARRSHSAPRVVSPRNKVNIALPLSMIRVEEPVKMKAGDWISLAGLVVSVIGFTVVINELIQITHTPRAGQNSSSPSSRPAIEGLAELNPSPAD
jgi:hypothetical protein